MTKPKATKITNKVVADAVRRVGGQSKLARELSIVLKKTIKQSDVWGWMHRDKTLSPQYWSALSQVSGIPIEKISPDIFGKPRTGATS